MKVLRSIVNLVKRGPTARRPSRRAPASTHFAANGIDYCAECGGYPRSFDHWVECGDCSQMVQGKTRVSSICNWNRQQRRIREEAGE